MEFRPFDPANYLNSEEAILYYLEAAQPSLHLSTPVKPLSPHLDFLVMADDFFDDEPQEFL
jgi:hypothetical protein